jgi:Uma2 family endonuclease
MVGTAVRPIEEAEVTRRLWTREEYEQLIEHCILGPDDRVELIAGEILIMTPQKGRHAMAVGYGQDCLLAVLGDQFHLRVQLPLALGGDSEPEPDLAVISGRRKDYPPDEHPTSAVLVVEIADTSVAYDRTRKAGIYARARIPEYWIVNLQARRLEVYRDPAPDSATLLGFAYQQRTTHGLRDRVSLLAVPGATVPVRDLFP